MTAMIANTNSVSSGISTSRSPRLTFTVVTSSLDKASVTAEALHFDFIIFLSSLQYVFL